MDKPTRNLIQTATQDARRLLEQEFREQLQGTFDIMPDTGAVAPQPGAHLDARPRFIRSRIVVAIRHEQAKSAGDAEAVQGYLREATFTTLNRFAALKLMEARHIVQECVSRGEQSAGFREFAGLAPGLATLPDHGYRLYLECLFDEIGTELGVLFDRRDPASLLWPRRMALLSLLDIVNRAEMAAANIWTEDETIGWIYQYFNGDDERKKMRKESAAPRNSRELAVRNQFFTPRYVVQFLTDNTLGRIWYEMTKGQTRLKDQCRYLVRRPNEIFLKPGESAPVGTHSTASQTSSEFSPGSKLEVGSSGLDVQSPQPPAAPTQEELLRQPVPIPHRPIKDPREIRMLDPACGSMHFGLYAFDLYEIIYAEAWDNHPELLKDLRAELSTINQQPSNPEEARSAFLRLVPRLIIEHNIHGIDIDPRAVQIAGLSLWLRAQRAWRDQDVKPAERPPIRKSNVVCAEPMPGEPEMLTDFVEKEFPAPERPAFAHLLTQVFTEMKLAGEAGSLLKIEEDIRSAIAQARAQWQERRQEFFDPAELAHLDQRRGTQRELASLTPQLSTLNLSGISDEQFWDKAEERIYDALRDYAEQAENGGGFQRRLFAEDAARGFAFIDVCHKRYDVALMNPPFGEGLEKTDALLQNHYKEVGRDLAATFIERGESLLGDAGTCGCIATRGLLIGHRLTDFRESHFFRANQLRFVADLGSGVLDAAVEVACTVLESAKSSVGCPCFDLTAEHEKGERLLFLIQGWSNGQSSEQASCLNLSVLGKLPDRVVTGWIPTWLSRLFSEVQPLDPNQAFVVKGLITGDDFRFIRLFPEVPARQIGHSSNWMFFAKGGEYSPYHYDIQTLLGWESSGRELKAFARMTYDSESRTIKNQDRFGLAGISYSMSSSIGFSARVHPSGTVLADIGPVILPRQGVHPLSLLAYLNSKICIALLKVWQGGRRGRYHWISDSLQGVPTPKLISLTASIERVEAIVALLREAARFDEAGTHFVRTRLAGEGRLGEQFESLLCRVESSALALTRLTEEIDSQVADVLCVPNKSLQSIKKLLFTETESAASVYRQRFPESSATCVSECVSYWFGVTFGRWDIRYATGEQVAPELPDPFAPLPACPPGQLQNARGLPARPEDVPASYPLRITWSGILVDDPNHPEDIESRVREVIEVIWPGRTAAVENEALDILGVKSLRDYFRKSFFPSHLSGYSKSRRQAPIYWPLSTPSANYTIWLYYHRFTKDTFYRVQEIATEKLAYEERKLTALNQDFGPEPAASQRKQLADQETFVQELRAFREEIARVAPLWNPDLNDGVIINFAPLWRLIAHRPWQKDVKACWDSLVAEEYDWSHLAMHLWPERVVPKCQTDRSIAIAHGLDEVFWEENEAGKAKPKRVTKPEIQKLIADRTSPAAKEALQNLLEAPVAGGANKRSRK